MHGDTREILASESHIQQVFAARVKRFYIANLIVAISLAGGFYLAAKYDFYREGFFGSTILLLIWIFTADRLRLCPACGKNPRDKEGLAATPRNCARCGVRLV